MEFVNEGCTKVTGYDPNALLIGGVSYGTDIIHAADRDHVRESVQNDLGTDDGFSVRYRIVTADDREKEVWDRGVGISENDTGLSLVGCVTEVPPAVSWAPG